MRVAWSPVEVCGAQVEGGMQHERGEGWECLGGVRM